MEGQTQEMHYTEEEIDLYDLCLILKKRLGLIAGVFTSVVLVTAVVSFLLPPVYRGTFTVRVPMVSDIQTQNVFKGESNQLVPMVKPKEAVSLISNIDRLREEEQFKQLSDALGISNEKAAELVELTANAPRDVKEFIEVVVDVRSPSAIGDFRDAIVRYLNENRYVRERIALRRASLLSLKAEIENNLSEVEAMKRLVSDQIRTERKKDIGFNPIEMEKEVIVFKQILRSIDDEVKLLKGFEVVVEPVISDRPVSPDKALNVTVAAVSSLFLGIVLAFFMEWLQRNRRRS